MTFTFDWTSVPCPILQETPMGWWAQEIDYGYSFLRNPYSNKPFYEVGLALLVDSEITASQCENPEWGIIISAIGGLRGPYSYNHFLYTIKEGGMEGYETLRVVQRRTALSYTSETTAESSVIARVYSLGFIEAIGVPRNDLMDFIKTVPPFEPRDIQVDSRSNDVPRKGNSRAWVLRVLEYMSKGSVTMSNGMQWAWGIQLPGGLNMLKACHVERSPVPITSFEVLQERILAHWRQKGRKITIYDKPTIPLDFLRELFV
ncbi:hypothetical protein CVT24_006033 [Panaeolus cyanescens]|uniref:Uncharacterized protein n=1 Tax=Panaeolus cyanescens TaxID=181874 RepID=A0A409YE39_9AGAR|nr:hypothetical protein CVT24_006033 [Panaeolus cyanescens]